MSNSATRTAIVTAGTNFVATNFTVAQISYGNDLPSNIRLYRKTAIII